MPGSRSRSTPPASGPTAENASDARSAVISAEQTAAGFTYNEARTALDLILAQLQSSDLDVEAMGDLYRRAQAYAQRCEQILEQVEQEILIWDPRRDDDPEPYCP